jgi:hypothetical protein
MKKILPLLVVAIFILSGFGAVALYKNIGIDMKTVCYENTSKGRSSYSHIIVAEYGTATWCHYCPYAHAALKNIYAGQWHPFYYISLVCDVNTHADQRADELGLGGYPTVYFDGGYKSVVGGYEGVQTAYNTSIVDCGEREVSDIDMDLSVTWNGAADMDIYVAVDNNEDSSYNGHLHVYVTEIVSSMGWQNDYENTPYTFAFLDYAYNNDVTISADSNWQNTISWDGHNYNDGYGNNFGGISYGNILVIATVFNSSTDETDETRGFRVGSNNAPNTPNTPDPADGETEVPVETELSWKCTDPDSDVVTYNVYFGESSSPPLVESDHLGRTYDPPGLLDFDTTYYWKIVAVDSQGATKTSPIWDFTTRGNDPPYTPNNPGPTDGATGVHINAVLNWTGGDPDGDDVKYDVYFGKNSPPPKVKSNQTSTSYDPSGVLDFDTKYYWQIIAWDEYSYFSVGPIWSFTTEKNIPPDTPSNPDPEDGAIDVDINKILGWAGGDQNVGDIIKYDIYFGTSSPPPLVFSNNTKTTYTPGTMNLTTTYYWKIVTKDSGGLTSTSPIWQFTTKVPPTAPVVNGPHSGKPGVQLCWTFNSYDPDSDKIYYIIHWGDGTYTETECVASGMDVEACHTYSKKGSFIIKVIAKECPDGLESSESTFDVTVPKDKTINSLLLLSLKKIMERFPNIFLLVQLGLW